jgi:hypothetical protein
MRALSSDATLSPKDRSVSLKRPKPQQQWPIVPTASVTGTQEIGGARDCARLADLVRTEGHACELRAFSDTNICPPMLAEARPVTSDHE